MNLSAIQSVFRKDFRYHFYLISFWLALVGIIEFGWFYFQIGIESPPAFTRFLFTLLTGTKLLVGALVVQRIVQSEPPRDDEGRWRPRPLSWRSLLLVKWLGCLVWVAVLPALMTAIETALIGASFVHILETALLSALHWSGFVAVMLLWASVTRRRNGFWVSLSVCVVAVIGFFILITGFDDGSIYDAFFSRESRYLAVLGSGILIVSSVIVTQFQYREARSRFVVLLFIAVLLALFETVAVTGATASKWLIGGRDCGALNGDPLRLTVTGVSVVPRSPPERGDITRRFEIEAEGVGERESLGVIWFQFERGGSWERFFSHSPLYDNLLESTEGDGFAAKLPPAVLADLGLMKDDISVRSRSDGTRDAVLHWESTESTLRIFGRSRKSMYEARLWGSTYGAAVVLRQKGVRVKAGASILRLDKLSSHGSEFSRVSYDWRADGDCAYAQIWIAMESSIASRESEEIDRWEFFLRDPKSSWVAEGIPQKDPMEAYDYYRARVDTLAFPSRQNMEFQRTTLVFEALPDRVLRHLDECEVVAFPVYSRSLEGIPIEFTEGVGELAGD